MLGAVAGVMLVCVVLAPQGEAALHPHAPPWVQRAVDTSAASMGEHSPHVVWVRLGRFPRVVFTGHFVCNACSRPYGAGAPSGTVASLRFDGITHRVTDFGLSNTPFHPPACGTSCPLPHGTVLDSALGALAKGSHGRYAPAGRAVGWHRCPIRLPTHDYRVIEARCLTRIFAGAKRNVVIFVARWHGRGRDGRRATGPILEHRWRVVEDGGGWVLRVESSGPWPH